MPSRPVTLLRVSPLAAALTLLCAPPPAQAQDKHPKLVVLVVFDQLGSKYLDPSESAYRKALSPTGGFARLAEEGTLIPDARFATAAAMTAPGHATIATGMHPAHTRIPLNEWYEGGAPEAMRVGPDTLSEDTPTLADRLRTAAPASRAAVVSLKLRSASLLGGRRPDLSAVLDKHSGEWQASGPFAGEWSGRETPRTRAADVDGLIARYAIVGARRLTGKCQADIGSLCSRAVTSAPTSDALRAACGNVEQTQATLAAGAWLVFDAARRAVETAQLGERESTDFVAIGASGHDLVGHWCGPRSAAMIQTLEQEDRALAAFLDYLTKDRGLSMHRDLVVVVTGDHGVAYDTPIARCRSAPKGARVIDMVAVADALDDVVRSRYPACRAVSTPPVHIAGAQGCGGSLTGTKADRFLRIKDFNLFVPREVVACAGDPAEAVARTLDDAIEQAIGRRALWARGLRVSFTAAEIRSGVADASMRPDYAENAWRNWFVLGRSGDLVLVPSKGWVDQQETLDVARHLVGYEYDVTVPVLMAGAGIAAGRRCVPTEPFSMVDLAPTLLEGVLGAPAGGRAFDGASRWLLFAPGTAAGCKNR